MTERLVHERTEEVLADRIRWARTFVDRARGLIARPMLGPGEGLIIDRASQVHTFLVRAPIDVVFCNRSWEVLHVISPMERRRISRWVRGSRWVVELPAGTAGEIHRGDGLRLGL